MKKQIFLAIVALGSIAFGQINYNAFNLDSGNGDFNVRRYGSSDTTWKIAFSPFYNGFSGLSTLVFNVNGGFNDGVRIEGSKVHISGNLGIGTASPSEKFQIGNAFSFHDSGNKVLFFSANSAGDLDASKYSGEFRFDPTNGKLSLGVSTTITSNPVTAFTLDKNGKVGIGSANPDEKLTVKGKIHAEEIKVDLSVPADYVFQKYFTGYSTLKPDYEMPSLNDIETFVKENHHLPNIPSAGEIQENGLHLGEMNNLLLQKVEELTLYIIEQNKRIEALEAKITEGN